jgi:flagella basal body P-ring formation protein FlgA
LATGVATTYDQVLGKETRRVLRPGDPFRLRDLQSPLLVKKGSLVTMILNTPMMQLTSQGKALENGALGDVIKVQNPRSGKTILGTVVEDRTVSVESSDAGQGR